MDIQKLKSIICERINLNPNDDFHIEKCWHQMEEILTSDIDEAKTFFENNCTDEEFYWISEIFEEIEISIQDASLISIWEERLNRISKARYCKTKFKSQFLQANIDYEQFQKSISYEIEVAKDCLI